MKFRNILAAAAALSMTAAPVLAAESRVDLTRAVAPVEQTEELGGDSTLLLIIAAIAIGVGIYFIADGDDAPTSP
jgi:hypothetical protein